MKQHVINGQVCSCGPSVGQKVFLNLCALNLADFLLSFPTIQRKINCLPLNADNIIVCLENGINKKKNCRSSIMPLCYREVQSKRQQIGKDTREVGQNQYGYCRDLAKINQMLHANRSNKKKNLKSSNCTLKKKNLPYGTQCCKIQVLKIFFLNNGHLF